MPQQVNSYVVAAARRFWGVAVTVFVASTLRVQAQLPQAPQSVKSPTTASLGQYGEVPVSLASGLPSISVPLYSLEEGQLKVPITLNYHASGVRPDVHPGWVGMGWSLQAGGVITRKVLDGADDSNEPRSIIGLDVAGFYYHNQVPNMPPSWNVTTWNQYSEVLDMAHKSEEFYRDTEPDEFSFNFSGYSGRFFWNPAREAWQVQCNRPITVALLPTNTILPLAPTVTKPSNLDGVANPKSFGGFIITGEDGTKYTFGNTTNAIEYSIGLLDRNGYWVANSWYLTKITHPTTGELVFNYERGDLVSQMYIAVNQTLSAKKSSGSIFTASGVNCGNFGGSTGTPAYHNATLSAPVYLTSIVGKSQRLDFNHSVSNELSYPKSLFDTVYDTWLRNGRPGSLFMPALESYNNYFPDCLSKLKWRQLNRITWKQNGTSLKSFDLTYVNDASSRLKLGSLLERGRGGVPRTTDAYGYTKSTYNFVYYDYYAANGYNIPVVKPLPPYLAAKTDHWGFFNNTDASLLQSNYYSLRQPNTDPQVYLSNLLRIIQYPTGGSTEFFYEQHQYRKTLALDSRMRVDSLTSNQTAGGVRVSRIVSYSNSSDAANRKVEKQYYYVTGYNPNTYLASLSSSGVLASPVKYEYDDYWTRNSGQSVNYYQTIFSSQSILPGSSTGTGSHVAYSEVVERQVGAGYTIYRYTNLGRGSATGYTDEAPEVRLQQETIVEPISSTEEERGKLLCEQVFNEGGQLLSRRDIGYVALNKNTEFVRACKVSSIALCPGAGEVYEEGTTYKQYTYSYLPQTDKQTEYFPNTNGTPKTTTVSYAYSAKRLPTSKLVVTGRGQQLLTTYKYPSDFSIPSSSSYTASAMGIKLLQQQNMVAQPVQTVSYTDNQVTAASVVVYTLQNQHVLPTKVLELATTQPLPSGQYQEATIGTNAASIPDLLLDSRLLTKITFDAYDEVGNVVQATAVGGPPSGYLWGYDKTLPTAQVVNANCRPADSNNPTLGNEASYLGFESGVASNGTDPNEHYWNINTIAADSYLARGQGHTGNYSWHLGCYTYDLNYGPGHTFSPERQQLRYKFSAWVKTDAGFGAGEGHLVLAVNRADDTSAGGGVNQNVAFGDTQGKWRYVEAVLDLNAAHATLGIPVGSERLKLVAFFYNASNYGSRKAFFLDDLRFQPVDASMTTYTHEPMEGVTSTSDASGLPVLYEYDNFQRLKLVRNYEGNIRQQQQYNYRQP